jgi:hypothetical protein
MGFNLNWKMFAGMAVPFIRAAGVSKENEDANTTGRDDLIGMSLVYVADLLQALIDDKPELPTPPAALSK